MNVIHKALATVRRVTHRHRWGAIEGGVHEAHQTCSTCGRTRRLRIDEPPQMHDQMNVHP